MFHRGKVIAALEAHTEQFAGYDGRMNDALAVYKLALAELSGLKQAEIEAQLAGIAWPGARPTAEHDKYPGLVVPFAQHWQTHEHARAWALEVLQGVPTIAVDGSQITPTHDISVPLGAVQIGWFVNPHAAGQTYIKDIAFEVLPPEELSVGDEELGSGFPDWRVNMLRFVRECEKLVDLMSHYAEATVKPVCFFDGSLVVSFAQNMRPERQMEYVRAVTTLLDASENYRVPLVGYIDTSYAGDLVAMLNRLSEKRVGPHISDGALLQARMEWGTRSTAWVCARDDAVEPVAGTKYYDRLAFVYLKTTANRSPARLDIPLWMLESGELEHTLDIVRAECVVGNGYPYAVETADAVAVISQRDRERFYRVFQEFAFENGLPLRFSRKTVSKLLRR